MNRIQVVHLHGLRKDIADPGEIDPSRLTPRVLALASDLFRHEAIMRLGPVPDDVLVSIVDDIYLPLVTASVTSDA